MSPAVVEADEVVLQSGRVQWNTVQVSTAKPFDQALMDLEKSPYPIY
jgi:hypothetical protein